MSRSDFVAPAPEAKRACLVHEAGYNRRMQKAKLKNPAALKEKAPAKFKVQFETTKGVFVVDVTRDLSPNGVDRFYNLAKNGSLSLRHFW